MAISEHLLGIALGIVESNVDNLTLCIEHGQHTWIQKTLVRGYVETLISLQHLVMNIRIYVNGVCLHQFSSCLVIAFALYALHLGKESGKLLAERLVVVNANIGLAVAFFKGNGVAVL